VTTSRTRQLPTMGGFGWTESVQILADGRLLFVGNVGSCTLTPDEWGSYANGTFSAISFFEIPNQSSFGGPVVVNPDGTVTKWGSHIQYDNPNHDRIQKYDPVANTWSNVARDVNAQHGYGGSIIRLADGRIGKFIENRFITFNHQTNTVSYTNAVVSTRFTQLWGPGGYNFVEGGFAQLPDDSFVGLGAQPINLNSDLMYAHRIAPDASVDVWEMTRPPDTDRFFEGADIRSSFVPYGSVKWNNQIITGETNNLSFEIPPEIYVPKFDRVMALNGAGYLMSMNANARTVQSIARVPQSAPNEQSQWDFRATLKTPFVGMTVDQLLGQPWIEFTAVANNLVPTTNFSITLSTGMPVLFKGTYIEVNGGPAQLIVPGDTIRVGGPFQQRNGPLRTRPNAGVATSTAHYGIIPLRGAAENCAAVLPNGNYICHSFNNSGLSLAGTGCGEWAEWDGNAFIMHPDGIGTGGDSWMQSLCLLPSGEMLVTTYPGLIYFRAFTGQDESARPKIDDHPLVVRRNREFVIKGRQLWGRHVGAQMGDDLNVNCNNPVVQLTSRSDGRMRWARVTLYGSPSITPDVPSQLRVVVPDTVPLGDYDMRIISAGNASFSSPLRVDDDGLRGGASGLFNAFLSVPTVYVATNGSDSNSGSLASPKATIANAISTVANGGQVILRAGTYREEVEINNKRVSISAFSGETVWIDGSTTIAGTWTQLSGPTRWSTPWTQWQPVTTDTTTYPQLVGNPLAGDPMMVWRNGVELTQVGNASAITPGTFFVDRNANLLVIGDSPTGATVEIAHRRHGLWVYQAATTGTSVSGIGFRKFATPMIEQAAVKLFSPACSITNCTVEDVANSGIYVYDLVNANNVTITNCTLRRIGQIGIGGSRCDGLRIANCSIDLANYKNFAIDQATGGIKITVAKSVLIEDNIITNSRANGIWLDQSCRSGIIQRNTVTNTTRHAIEVEISNSCLITNNIINGTNGDGIEVNESNQITVTNNTLTDVAGWCLRILEAGRTFSTPGNASDFDNRVADPWPLVGTLNAWRSHTITMTGNDCTARAGSQGNSFFGYEDVTNASVYTAAAITLNNNTYRWTAPGAGPQWVGNVETGGSPDQSVRSDMASWRTLTGFDLNSTLVSSGTGSFSIAANGNILSPSGTLFVPVGMNAVPRPIPAPTGGFWLNNMRYATGQVANFISRPNWNTLRLTCWHDPLSGYTQQNVIDGILACVDEYVAQGVVVIPANHEWTRSGIPSAPTRAALEADDFFLPWYNAMLDKAKTSPYVWVNPLNEPTDYLEDQTWVDTHNYLYTYARNRGFNGILVIDLPGFGQDISFLSDPLLAGFMSGKTNVVLAFHNYGITNEVADAYKNTNYPVMIGETGRTLSGESATQFQWCVDNARVTNWGLVAWWGAGNTNNEFSFRNNVGAAWYEAGGGPSAMGTAMETV
jgi:parallel beta-helix repeat protein